MAKDFAKAFYHSAAWQACRDGYIQQRIMINGGLCERCGEAPGYIIHHKTRITQANINDPAVSLNFENLEYVCKRCHDIEHEAEFRGREVSHTAFDAFGRIIPDRQ